MTLKEFLEKNPEAIKEASKCKDVAEFKKLTESAGIAFENDEKLNKAFELVKSQNTMELTDDALNAVSGGKSVYKYGANDVYTGLSKVYTVGSGKKVN